jgi:pimeloyl-ACP methyl ester carboxylesterase
MLTFPTASAIRLPARRERGERDGSSITLSTHELGDGPAVVFCHGFPDLALGWRHQLEPVARAGFRAIAPDQRGYGGSSAPAPIEAYGLTELTGDLVGLLDALEIERAVFVGHDWGGFVAWAMPILHPERVLSVAGICTPYMPFPNVAKHLAIVDGEVERQYVAWFQQPGVAEAAMDTRVRPILTRILRTGAPLEALVRIAFADGRLDMNPFRNPEKWPPLGEPVAPPSVLDAYCRVYERTGFRGGINWYRNIDRNWALTPFLDGARLGQPSLFVAGERDLVIAMMPDAYAALETNAPGLTRKVLLPEAGHWIQQERPHEVNAALIDFARRHCGD